MSRHRRSSRRIGGVPTVYAPSASADGGLLYEAIPFEKACRCCLEVQFRPDSDEWQQRMNREGDCAGNQSPGNAHCEQPVFEVA
jgi:hypothetical protein